MNVSNVSNVSQMDPALSAQSVDKRAQLQMLLLRKSLDAQQSEADVLKNLTDGKGQNLDIRV